MRTFTVRTLTAATLEVMRIRWRGFFQALQAHHRGKEAVLPLLVGECLEGGALRCGVAPALLVAKATTRRWLRALGAGRM